MADDIRKKTSQRDDRERREELADFLKTRRARVKPAENEFFQLSRRRTPGLRREEVAEMTGVSASWYTWLEQARDIRPSPELLSRLSKVLRLNPAETSHLFHLAGIVPPESFETSHEEVPKAVSLLVTEVLQAPAFVLGERFDFLLWNRHFSDYFIDLEKIPKERLNWLDLVFTDETYKKRQDWRESAGRTVAEFRWSVGKQIGSPWVKQLVGRLRKESPEFAEFWRLHDIQERNSSRIIESQNEKFGKQLYVRSFFIPAEAENLRVVILMPIAPEKKKKLCKD